MKFQKRVLFSYKNTVEYHWYILQSSRICWMSEGAMAVISVTLTDSPPDVPQDHRRRPERLQETL